MTLQHDGPPLGPVDADEPIPGVSTHPEKPQDAQEADARPMPEEMPDELRAVGVPFDAESARVAAEKRWSASRSTQDDPETILRELLTRQRAIAAGNTKASTAAQQTAAAKQVLDILVALREYDERQDGVVAWEDVPEVKRAACAKVLAAPSSFSLTILDLDIEESAAGDSTTLGTAPVETEEEAEAGTAPATPADASRA